MMIKRAVIDKTRGFDPDFFLYCEETEWSYRIWKAGYKIKFVSQARIIHLEGMSGMTSPALKPKISAERWFSRFLYFEKVYNKHYSFWLYNLHVIRCLFSFSVFFVLRNKNKLHYWKSKLKVIRNGYQRYTNRKYIS